MKNLKKLSILAASALLAIAVLAAGCGSDSASSGSSSKNTTVTVGATPVPHGEILNEIKPLLAKEGVDLKVVEFTDYGVMGRFGSGFLGSDSGCRTSFVGTGFTSGDRVVP